MAQSIPIEVYQGLERITEGIRRIRIVAYMAVGYYDIDVDHFRDEDVADIGALCLHLSDELLDAADRLHDLLSVPTPYKTEEE